MCIICCSSASFSLSLSVGVSVSMLAYTIRITPGGMIVSGLVSSLCLHRQANARETSVCICGPGQRQYTMPLRISRPLQRHSRPVSIETGRLAACAFAFTHPAQRHSTLVHGHIHIIRRTVRRLSLRSDVESTSTPSSRLMIAGKRALFERAQIPGSVSSVMLCCFVLCCSASASSSFVCVAFAFRFYVSTLFVQHQSTKYNN